LQLTVRGDGREALIDDPHGHRGDDGGEVTGGRAVLRVAG